MKTSKEKCGCVVEVGREAYVKMCPAHEAEYQKIHARWAEEHRSTQEKFNDQIREADRSERGSRGCRRGVVSVE